MNVFINRCEQTIRFRVVPFGQMWPKWWCFSMMNIATSKHSRTGVMICACFFSIRTCSACSHWANREHHLSENLCLAKKGHSAGQWSQTNQQIYISQSPDLKLIEPLWWDLIRIENKLNFYKLNRCGKDDWNQFFHATEPSPLHYTNSHTQGRHHLD